MNTLLQDVRYALRTLGRRPTFTALAVICLGIGIGATTAILSPVDVFLLRPLPYPSADRLAVVWNTNAERGWTELDLSVPDFLDYRERSRTLDLAAYDGQSLNLSDEDLPVRLLALQVSHNFFRVLATPPVLGRGFLSENETPGNARVVVLSHRLWVNRFGGERDVLGRTLRLDGEAYVVVGVAPAGLNFPDRTTELYLPLSHDGTESRGSHFLSTVGRVVPGATLAQANDEVATIGQALAETYPATNVGMGARAAPLWDALFGEEFRQASLIATVAVTLLLLIAAANVANLLLAQAAGREREVAVRRALGAGAGRIVRQLITESLLLGLMGGVVGIAVSFPAVDALVGLMPAWFPRVDEIGIDGRVLAYAVAVTLAAGLVAGIAPALQVVRQDLRQSLQDGGRGASLSRRGGRLRSAFVIAEVGLAMVLLVSSSLLVKGFLKLRTTDLGFEPRSALTVRADLPAAKYPENDDRVRFADRLIEALAALPGVQSVGITSLLPLIGDSRTSYQLEGEEVPAGQSPIVSFRSVTPEYFETLGIPVLRGRGLHASDRSTDVRAVVVNEAFVRRHWPEGDPLGRRLVFGGGPREIVGVVRDAREVDLESAAPLPMAYFAFAQTPSSRLGIVLRTTGDPTSLTGAVRSVVLALDPDQPVFDVLTFEDRIAANIQANTVLAKVMMVLAVIAIVLAVVGVYGVMAYSVTQRTHEIGVRMALGADRRDVIAMVVREGARIVAVGGAIGLGLAAIASRGLSLFLFGVKPFDPLIFGAVALLLAAAAFVASYLPARRASTVSPLVALRAE